MVTMSTDALRAGSGPRVSRREQAAATRALLLRTAERLYAERGLADVSNRQIVEAAGVANNSALTYHFGTREDLIRAIARSHAGPVFRRTRELLAAIEANQQGTPETRDKSDKSERSGLGPGRARPDPGEARARVAAFVLPYTGHLASLGTPSWCARFTAQLSADPTFGAEVDADAELRGLIEQGIDTLRAHAPGLSPEDVSLRNRMVRLTVIHTCADQERIAAETGTPAPWDAIGAALTDALTGLLLAPQGW
jgi:AcrR family transcriptional regulator